jgi:hypothetical protein
MQMVLVCRIDFVRLFCSDRLLKEESRHSCEGELVIETLQCTFPQSTRIPTEFTALSVDI